jgi:hypothetical protein
MNYSHERYNQLVAETVDKIKQLSVLKGGEYAGDHDRLANFRRGGERIAIPMETTWWVYANKHWDAITQFVQDLNWGKKRERMESLAGRADDLIVYLILFKAMLEEREDQEKLRSACSKEGGAPAVVETKLDTSKDELQMIVTALGRQGDSMLSRSGEMRMADPWYELQSKIAALITGR